MSDEKRPSQKSTEQTSNTDETPALNREAQQVERIMQPKGGDHDDETDLAKSERKLQVEQDARVQAGQRQAKEAGAGSHEPSESLNQDG